MRLVGRTTNLIHSPIGEAHALIPQRTSTRELLDLSQAAPTYPAPPVVVDRIAAAASEPDAGRYAPQPGLPELLTVFAQELSNDYGGQVLDSNILITAGCNQAFCLAISALAEPGDQVLLQVPYYFNHDMWMRLDGLDVVHLPTDHTFIPDVGVCEALLTPSTRAVVLVSPGNPTGVTIPPDVIAAFAQLAERRDIALILDETYRTFRGTTEPAHNLFTQANWGDHVISLHSFSKDLAVPGYRVGAVVAGQAVNVEILKLLDCITICAPRISQEGVLAGLQHAGDWRVTKAQELAHLQQLFEDVMSSKPGGFQLESAGAYFGWVKHPFPELTSAEVSKRLVLDHDVLVIPGTAFTPEDQGYLRFSFANLAESDMVTLRERLEEMG